MHVITRYALQIRDTICNDIEKGNIQCDTQTKYAYKIDEQSPIYNSARQLQHSDTLLHDVITQLQQYFPDSKITIQEKERMDGFTVTRNMYIEIDWS